MRAGLGVATFIVACAMTSSLGVARADPTEGSAAAAESLFQDARKLMDAKRYAEACPKLVASEKLAPAIGTLLNLADCYERNNQLASAWERFHEAIALAQRLGRPDREKTARERAEKLEPRLVKLTIGAPTGVDVKLDGTPLDAAVLGTAVPVDTGRHTIEASANGKKPYHLTIDIGDTSRSVDVPPLEDAPVAKSGGGTVVPPPKPPEPPPVASDDDGERAKKLRIIGIVGMGVGVVGFGIGTIFGLETSSKWSDSKPHCISGDCDSVGATLAGDAKSAGNISTVAFIAGAVFAAGGAVLFFTSPPPGKSGVSVGATPSTLVLRGAF